jgi:mono/diheme cytochrome c family protein
LRLKIAGGLLLMLAVVAAAQATKHTHPAPASKAAQIAAGKYLVENVAMCSTCHTPRLPDGNFDTSKMLMGGQLPFKVPTTGRWAKDAPRIAGLRRWEDDEIVILLTTGKLETGLPMRKPMPQFHMSESDARAVVAYLRSLSPTPVKKSPKARSSVLARVH